MLDCDGNGWVSDVVSGLEWVISNAQQPAVVQISAHLDEPSSALDAAVRAVLQANISVVVGAGNQNSGTPLVDLRHCQVSLRTTLLQRQRSLVLSPVASTDLLHCQGLSQARLHH